MHNYYGLITYIQGNIDWGLGIGDWAQSPIPNPQIRTFNNIKFSIKIQNNYLYYLL